MSTTVSLIKVGTSHAFIIPAKWMRSKGITPDTRFTLEETPEGGLSLTPQISSVKRVVLPKAKEKIVLPKRLTSLFGTVSLSQEEIEADERLKHMLAR